jgi:tRNA (guanine10-N2)-dimethyltransferase
LNLAGTLNSLNLDGIALREIQVDLNENLQRSYALHRPEMNLSKKSVLSVFVLSGENSSLPLGEIAALIETYSKNSTCIAVQKRVIVSDVSDEWAVNRIAERSAFCRFGGLLIGLGSSLEELFPYPAKEEKEDFKLSFLSERKEERSFAVRTETLSRESCARMGSIIKEKTGWRVSLEGPEYVFQVENGGENFILGLSRSGEKKFSWKERRPRARRFFLPSAIYPKLSRALVNLSRAREGDVFLDPFCGSGSLLIESQLMNIDSLGIDLIRWIARGALLNTKKYHNDHSLGILRGDSTRAFLPLRKVDAVATDVPYGRASSTRGKTTERIIKEFLESLTNVMPSPSREDLRQKYCVIMHPSNAELASVENEPFRLVERHLIYVHRNLTRAISVFKRI